MQSYRPTHGACQVPTKSHCTVLQPLHAAEISVELWMLPQVSEGLDFADANARCVVILGLPFPNAMDPQVTTTVVCLPRFGVCAAVQACL